MCCRPLRRELAGSCWRAASARRHQERSLAKGSEHEWPRTTTSSSSSSSSSSSRLLLQLQLRLRLRLQVQVRVPLSATGYHLVPVVPLRTRKAAEHQTRSGPVQTHPNSRLHLQGARWRTRCLSLVAARRAVGNILPLKEQRDGRGHLLSKLNVLWRQPHAPPQPSRCQTRRRKHPPPRKLTR